MNRVAEWLDWKGKQVTVMGLGRFGGGVGAVRFLAERGARVTVTDLKSESELADSLSALDDLRLEGVHLGEHPEDDFLTADLVVVSPAVPRDHHCLQLARRAGVPLSSEIILFWQYNAAPVIGVTGSNGKSTTAAMVHAILESSRLTCWLGGNIGKSLLPVVEEIAPEDWVVLELSSFQLNDLDRLFTSPRVAVVTNFSPNHLDWHGSMEAYRRSKQAILRWQPESSLAILNADDDVANWPSAGRRLYFGTQDVGRPGLFVAPAGGEPTSCERQRADASADVIYRDENGEQVFPLSQWLPLPGRHNFQNALAAGCAALAIGADPFAVARGLQNFQPLPHRLAKIAEANGRSFYNDSLATTPEAACMALESFSAPVVLLAGGYDKEVDLSTFARNIHEKAKAVALMGQTAESLAFLIEQCQNLVREPGASATGVPKKPPAWQECDSLEAAFRWAVQVSEPGDVVLLSPGCASYDRFENFAQRGQRFAELVEGYRRASLPAT